MRWRVAAITLFALTWIGCNAPVAHFEQDAVYIHKKEKEESAVVSVGQKEDVRDALTALFGTPDEPFVLAGESGFAEVVDDGNLQIAAGRVTSDRHGRQQGLYRQHCSHCHGTTGDGKGPTAAYLNPYPRDYRRGVFKFKSTPRGSRPTDEDLKTILVNGVAGTAMPSFKLLPDNEIEALLDYVKYLSIRGEVERALIDECTQELEEEDRLIDDENMADSQELLVDILTAVVKKWQKAESDVTPVPAPPPWDNDELMTSIEKGKHLFYGSVANCVKCHGESQLGDGQVDDYDDWVKDYSDDWIKETKPGKKQELLANLKELGALEPRNTIPRNLREGVYRGGRRPVDVYWRIFNGIDGSTMPAAMMRQPGQANGLTNEDVWHLVNYVFSLPYESMTSTGPDEPVYSRPRM